METQKYDYGYQETGYSFDEVFIGALKRIRQYGTWNNPRGFSCKEIISPQLIIYSSSGNSVLTQLRSRKLNYAFGVIEMFTYLSQVSKPDVLLAYNKNMGAFLNEQTGDFDAPYGKRIAVNGQLEYCYQELKRDPDTRRAVVMIHQPEDCRVTKDSACTLSLQFLNRNGRLDMIGTMRSNDIILGMCYDIPAFTFLQEVMAYWLGLEVGHYIHQPGSLHYYNEFCPMVDKLISEYDHVDGYDAVDAKRPKWELSYDETAMMLDFFWKQEEVIRNGGEHELSLTVIGDYLRQLKTYWEKKLPKNKTLFDK